MADLVQQHENDDEKVAIVACLNNVGSSYS